MMNHAFQRNCHNEGQHILTIGSCTVHASGSSHPYAGYALVINASGSSGDYFDVPTGKFGAQQLVKSFLKALPKSKYCDVPELVIPWKDQSAPALDKHDWCRLIEDLRRIKGKVLVHCVGGHGRTGTALCALLWLSGALTKDPIVWLRKQYCDNVVESAAQINYLKSLGVKTNIEIKPYVPPVYNGIPYTFHQSQYDLTKKPDSPNIGEFVPTETTILYKCIVCQGRKIAVHFYQTFLDMSGLCWDCHEFSKQTNSDTIQSA